MNMNITTLPEAAFNERIWNLLQEIRTQHLFIGGLTPIVLEISHANLGDAMKEKLDLIGQMRKWKIVKIAGDGTFDENTVTAFVQLKVCNPLFDQVYELYEHGELLQAEPKRLFGLFHKLITSKGPKSNPDVKKFLAEKPLAKQNDKIEYNPITGVGSHGEIEFMFKDGSAEYRLFARLFAGAGKKVSRFDVLELIKFYEDGQDSDPTRKTAETNAINAVTKELRTRIGLTPKQLVLNAGNLTLVSKKAPDSPQTDPK